LGGRREVGLKDTEVKEKCTKYKGKYTKYNGNTLIIFRIPLLI